MLFTDVLNRCFNSGQNIATIGSVESHVLLAGSHLLVSTLNPLASCLHLLAQRQPHL